MLASLYQYGEFAYIGGAFGKGLHNILEAATFGLPLFFGNKNYKKFNEALMLEKLEGAFPISNKNEFDSKFRYLYLNKEDYQKASKRCINYVNSNLGATDLIMEYCKKIIKK